MRTISIRLDDRTDAVLCTYCERHGLTQTNAVKAAIECLAEAQRPTPSELAERLGLIGAFRGAEGNLAAEHSQRVKGRLRAKRSTEQLPVTTRRRRLPAR